MNSSEWNTTDRFVDSSGKLEARIFAWHDGEVHMERWNRSSKNPRPVRFTLPEWFFMNSPQCGWTKVVEPVEGGDGR